MTALLVVFNILIIYDCFIKKKLISFLLFISFFLQYSLRFVLYDFDVNPNLIFNQNVTFLLQAKMITFLFLISLYFIFKLFPEKKIGPNKPKLLISIFSLVSLFFAFIFLGGLSNPEGMVLKPGSSILFYLSLLGYIFFPRKSKGLFITYVILLSVFSTQKLFILILLGELLVQSKSLRKSMVVVFVLSIALFGVAIFREASLIETDNILVFLGGTIFGHYESVLPLLRVLEDPSFNYPQYYVYSNMFWDLIFKTKYYFIAFNDYYFPKMNVIIVPSILGYFYLLVSWFAPLAAALYVRLLLGLWYKILLVFKMPTVFLSSVALLILECSPDGLSSYIRMTYVLVIIGLITNILVNEKRSI